MGHTSVPHGHAIVPASQGECHHASPWSENGHRLLAADHCGDRWRLTRRVAVDRSAYYGLDLVEWGKRRATAVDLCQNKCPAVGSWECVGPGAGGALGEYWYSTCRPSTSTWFHWTMRSSTSGVFLAALSGGEGPRDRSRASNA